MSDDQSAPIQSPIRDSGGESGPFYKAFVAAQGQFAKPAKDTMGQVGNAQRPYADLASVVDAVRQAMATNGLGFTQAIQRGDIPSEVIVTTRIFHESGYWIESDLAMNAGTHAPQQVGSASTYCKRYSLVAMLGLAPGDDDDGAAAQGAHEASARRSSQQQPSRQRREQAAPPPPEDRGERVADEKDLQALRDIIRGVEDKATRDALVAKLAGEFGDLKVLAASKVTQAKNRARKLIAEAAQAAAEAPPAPESAPSAPEPPATPVTFTLDDYTAVYNQVVDQLDDGEVRNLDATLRTAGLWPPGDYPPSRYSEFIAILDAASTPAS